MTRADGPFRAFVRDNRPLSAYLRQTYMGPLMERIRALSEEDLVQPTRALVDALVTSVRVEPPQLLGKSVRRKGRVRTGPDLIREPDCRQPGFTSPSR